MEIISRKEAKEQGLKRYFTGKPCKHDHIAERITDGGGCTECKKILRQENKEKIAKYMRAYRQENKEKNSKYMKEYQQKNKEKITEYMKSYRQENKGKISKHQKAYQQKKPIPFFIRSSLHRILSNWEGGRERSEATHGYTYEQLERHMESQFAAGMSWDNYGIYGWHIDHIKPIKAFLDEGITDPAIINALDNLQPLWAKDNLSKGVKYDK